MIIFNEYGDVLLQGTKYWFWFATLYLIFLTWKDFKDNKIIDDRHNFIMIGMTLSLSSHYPVSLVKLLILIVFIIFFVKFLNKLNVMGGADVSTMGWIIYGFGILNLYFLAAFMIIFALLTGAYTALKWGVTKAIKRDFNVATQFYPVILSSYFLTSLILKLY